MSFVVLGEYALVEAEGYRDISDLLVVVKVGYHAGQRICTVDRLLCAALRLGRSLGGGSGVLRGGVGRLLRLLDARLGAIIGALDRAVVGRDGIVELVCLLHQRRGLRANVVLRGAARGDKQ